MTDRQIPPRPAPSLVDPEYRRRLNRRLRAAFIEGAEQDSLRRLGRGADGGGARAGPAALSGGHLMGQRNAICRTFVMLTISVVSAACGGGTAVPIDSGPAPSSASPSPAVLTKEQLGVLFLAAADNATKIGQAADEKLTRIPTGEEWKQWCREWAATERAFGEQMLAISWPTEYEADVRDLLEATTTYELLANECTKAETTAALRETLDKMDKAKVDVSAATDDMRIRLGLMSVPAS